MIGGRMGLGWQGQRARRAKFGRSRNRRQMYQRRPSFVNHPPQDFSRASLKKGKWGNLKASIDESKCTACGACADICPAGAIIINSRARVDAALCTGCGACVQACANGAISLMEQ